jgi:ferric iron reductase protein FhuF
MFNHRTKKNTNYKEREKIELNSIFSSYYIILLIFRFFLLLSQIEHNQSKSNYKVLKSFDFLRNIK